MIRFVRVGLGVILLAALGGLPGHASDPQYWRLATPLQLEVGVSHLSLKRRNIDTALFHRRISYLRSATLVKDAVFNVADREVTLEAGAALTGTLVLRPWGAEDAVADLMFEDSPEIRALYKAGHHPNDPEVVALRKIEQEKLKAYIASDQFIVFDPTSYAESAWVYCGTHVAVDDRGAKRGETICLGDRDGDGSFDGAYKIAMQDSIGLERMKGLALQTSDLSAPYRLEGPVATGYAALVTVRHDQKTFCLQYGLGRVGTKRVWPLSFGNMAIYQQTFEVGHPLDSVVLGDHFRLKAAKGVKLYGDIEGAHAPTVLVRNYGAHLP